MEETSNPEIRMEEETYPEILGEEHNTVNNERLEDKITVDQEYSKSSQTLQDNINILKDLIPLIGSDDPLEEYFKATQSLSSWMSTTFENFPSFPSKTTSQIDLASINSAEVSLSGIENKLSSKLFEYNQLNDLLTKTNSIVDASNEEANQNLVKMSSSIENSWNTFTNLVNLGKLKLQELNWVIELRAKVVDVDVEVKKVEAMLDGVEESIKKAQDDGGITSSPNNTGMISTGSSSDITVTGIVFSTSVLDEWYTKVVAVEEMVLGVDAKVKEINQFTLHDRFIAPDDLIEHIQNVITSNVSNLKNKINSTKQKLQHDRRIGRWFDDANEVDKYISDTKNKVKDLEIPDFVNKHEWSEDDLNLISIVNDRRETLISILNDSNQCKSKIDDLDRKAFDITTAVKDSMDREDQAAVELMTKQLKNLNDRLIKLSEFITLLLEQTTKDRFSIIINLLTSMQNMRNQMAQIRKTIIEHNDAGLVHGDVKDLETQITDFESNLLTDDSAISKALRNKHAKLLLTIQNIRIALAENKLKMAAYLSPSSPTSPNSASSEFDRLSVKIQDQLDAFHTQLVSPPTYMIDTANSENDEPQRVHGLTCTDDHVDELTERYGKIESDLTSFERSLWVEFWLKSEPAKKSRGNEVIDHINDLEAKFSSIKDLIEERNHDLQNIKEGREFARSAHEIRDKLDEVKGKMRKGDTTTDASIQELDALMVDTDKMLNNLESSYTHLISPEAQDQSYREAFNNHKEQYVRVQAWIEEVRVWFKEAERIRLWIDKRINTLESVPQIDVFQEGEAPATQEQVDEWQNDYDDLEREVEKFDAEDMTRLRAHVKSIMGSEVAPSDSMSPADTMTISITLQTLTILDQLLEMLKRRENELIVLALRVKWEREHNKALNVRDRITSEINEFILNRGRWKPPSSPREDGWFIDTPQPRQRDVTTEAQTHNNNIDDFENNIIPPTGEIFDELVDSSNIQVPEHLLVRQENLEEGDLQDLKDYFAFAQEILTQRKQVLDYAETAENTHTRGISLKNELIKEEENPHGGSVEKDYISRVNELNNRVETSWDSMAMKVIYPEHQSHDQTENDTVREGVDAYHRNLQALLQETNEALKNYQRALRFVKMAEEYKKEAARLEEWITKKNEFVKNRKLDVFQEPCRFSAKNIEDYVTGNNQIVMDVHDFDKDELKVLHTRVAELVAEIKAVGTKCVNTEELNNMMTNLDTKLGVLQDDIQLLRQREPDEVDAAQKRLVWEDSYKDSRKFIDTSLKDSKDFIASKASWNTKTPEDKSAHEVLDQEYSIFKEKVDTHLQMFENDHKSKYDAFIEASEKLTGKDRRNNIEKRQSNLENDANKLNEHVYYTRDLLDQRAVAVEYNSEATALDKIASELKANLIDAEKNVSKGPSEIDFETNIKDFNQNVKNIWEEYGSKIPYPTSPIMNEVKVTKNAVIKEAAQKRLSDLESMGEELDKLYETYKSSLALQERSNECLKDSSRIQDWIAERLKDLNDRKVDPLTQDCLWNESEVHKMIEEHEKFKQENTRVDIEDVSQVRRNLETLLEDIKKAHCKSVDQKLLRDALDNLNKNFSDLQNQSSLHQLDLNVLQERAKWEDLYGPNSTLLNDLTNQVNDFIADKARWSPETAEPESDLQQEFTDIKQKVSEFEEKPLALTKSAYNDMKSAIKSYLSQQPPSHIANRHNEFTQHFDDLIGRMDLAKQVLDQRDAIDAYLNQSNIVEKEGLSLKDLLKSTEENCETDPGFAEKIATFNESLNNLKKDFVAKILYPKDKQSEKDVNAPIKQVVDERMEELEKLSKEIDNQFKSYKKTMEFSGELDDALANAKKIEDELDHFIFEKASWQTQDPDIRKDVDSLVKNLLAELDEINNKVAKFEKKTLNTMNTKFDEYQNNMNADEKNVPEHVEKRHKELNELLDELKALDDYAREVINQRKDVTEYMNNSAMLEKEARKIQQILLTNEPSSPGGEGNTVSNAVDNFAERVEQLWNEDASKINYPKCEIQNDKDRVGRSGDCNSVIREAVNAQNESLKSLANSLNDLLLTHQNVLRRKKMIESYMNQAKDVETWIQPKSDILNSILNDDTLGELTEGRLRELIGEVDSVEAARQAYNSAFDFAKNLADKLIEEMTYEIQHGGEDVEDVKADLELVRSRAEEIDALWVELQDNVLKSKQRLEQALQVVEFKEKAKGILSKVDDLSNIITNSLVESVSDAEMKDWQIKLNSLEQAEFFDLIKLHDLVQENLKDNFGILSDKESKEAEAILGNVINAINSLKQLMGDKTEEIERYKSAQISGAYLNRSNDLQKWIDDFIAAFANAKPTYGIMKDDDSELNIKNFHELAAILENFQNQLPYRNEQFDNIREEYEDITSQEGIRELQDIMNSQAQLNTSWENLSESVNDFKNFTAKVDQWHEQHGVIYKVEANILDGLESRINALPSVDFSNLEAEGKELDEKIKQAALILENTKAASNHIPFTPDDNLDETNRQNFDLHHDKASKKLLELSDAFKTALTAAHNASQLAAFHADADRIIKECYEGTAVVKSRHEDLDRSGYYALEVEPLANVLRKAIDEYTESEDKLGIYDQKVKVDLKQEADKLINQNPEANKDRILNIFSKVTGALEKFSDAVALERRELELVRRVYAHAKSAHDIKNWMSSCKLAMLNIQVGVDIIDQEVDIVDLEEKVASFQTTVDQFKDMSHRVLIPEADSRDIDEPQPEESNPKIKESVQTRTNRVLEEWYGLNDLLAKLRSNLNASKEAQEVSRTIKDILMAIGQVKERALNVESFITGEGVPRLPTKDDVNDGVRELDEIQKEVDHILTPRIEELDDMINNLTENDKGYVQQRAGIAEALANLQSLIDNKRVQLREAEKLAKFGTKADEMNALMASLLEVVDAATTTTPDCPLQLLSVIDLQSRFTELDTKYNYYHPIIVQKLADAQRAAEPLKDDWRVVDRLGILIEQWNELNEVALAKRDELSRLLSGQKPLIKTRPGRSNSQSGTSPSRNLRHRGSAAISRAASRTPTRLSPSPTPGTPGSPRRPPIRLLPHSVNNYVPDTKDPLDVEVARIVNACPVKIKVSMVEGEPGKYMFGEVEPKLCYCRILRSRMVMVRVGGGWAELSKFLVEHANLEQKYIPKARSFVGSDEAEPGAIVGQSSGGPSFYEANIRFVPKGSELRIEGPEGGSPLALKRMSYSRKVSRDTNDRSSRLIKPSSLAKSPTE